MALIMLCVAKSALADASYRIRKGDTVSAIAKRRHVSVRSILNANGLTENSVLSIGRTLRIPEPANRHRRSLTSKRKASAGTSRCARKAPTSSRYRMTSRYHIPWYEEYSEPKPNRNMVASSDLIRTAMAYRGTRYQFGGTSRGGFDCSGFTRYIFAKYGVHLPHSSRSQFWHGRPVRRIELQPGDLVFFHTHRSGISHVGIYVGNNRFVHASNVRRGVTVDSLGSGYYAARYRGARRVN